MIEHGAELFTFLADKNAEMHAPNVVIVTKEDGALNNCTITLFLHTKNAA